MAKHIPQEHSARVLALALAAWGLAVLGAAASGRFAMLSVAELAGLAIFVMLYVLATFILDTTLRGFVVNAAGRLIVPAAIVADLAIAAAIVALAGEHGAWQASLARPAYAFVLLFVAPLAVVLHLAWLEKPSRRLPERSPGASPVST
jgi:hypothetical protein